MKKIAIVGNPNVGKSALFNALTKRYVAVSNYPGTTVDISRGDAIIDGVKYEVMDTPGMYSLFPITEEERVARRILMDERPGIVIHVADARNLSRMLPLTLQLIEAGLPLILAVNMMDEAEDSGIAVDTRILEKELGIPAIGTVSTTGDGVADLQDRIISYERRL